MSGLVDILIPSYNNLNLLGNCVDSINRYTSANFRVTIVNNGEQKMIWEGALKDYHQSLSPGENLGWAKGINWAGRHTDGEFVLMLNDDTQIVDHDCGWLARLMRAFREPTVAAIGPISNKVMGFQQLQASGRIGIHHFRMLVVPVLSGFCILCRRDALDDVGWFDEQFDSGADDIDLSFKLRDSGYNLVCARDVFVYHYGSVTGKREYGDYWNSNMYSIETRMKIFRKWGIRKYIEFLSPEKQEVLEEDAGRKEIKDYIDSLNGAKGLDLGAGPYPISEKATSVDIADGYISEGRYAGKESSPDVSCDINKGLPFDDDSQDYVCASHFLEHVPDPIKVVDEIQRVLKPNGVFLCTMPSQDRCDVIPLDPTHLHAWSPDSFSHLLKRTTKLKPFRAENLSPGYNFVLFAKKESRGRPRKRT